MSKETDLDLIEKLEAKSNAVWQEVYKARRAAKLMGEANYLVSHLRQEAWLSIEKHIERMKRKFPYLGYGGAHQMNRERWMVDEKSSKQKFEASHQLIDSDKGSEDGRNV